MSPLKTKAKVFLATPTRFRSERQRMLFASIIQRALATRPGYAPLSCPPSGSEENGRERRWSAVAGR